jgi:hypothetical protein
MHGGRSTGARSVEGKRRQAEGHEHWLRLVRGQGRKPGPAKGTGGRPRKTAMIDPAERLRADTLAALGTNRPKGRSTPMPDAPDQELWSFIEQVMADMQIRPMPSKPVLAVSNSEPPLPAIASPPPELTLVHDANVLASDVEAIGTLAMARIKETLAMAKPFDPADANYVALLKFTASVYGSTMNTILRADENRLRHRAVDRLPELLERVAEEERKRDARRTIEGTVRET